jgi:diazepam-binding inhibitor (GABA receptor modulator, acyl-CoA-binding protein)
MSMSAEDVFFHQAVKDVKTLTYTPNNETLLKLYAYYKQATIGNNNLDKPGFLDFKGNAKWNAWEKVKNTSKLSAKVNYIKLVKKLQLQQ